MRLSFHGAAALVMQMCVRSHDVFHVCECCVEMRSFHAMGRILVAICASGIHSIRALQHARRRSSCSRRGGHQGGGHVASAEPGWAVTNSERLGHPGRVEQALSENGHIRRSTVLRVRRTCSGLRSSKEE